MFFFSLISLVTTWEKKNEAVLRKVGTVRNGGEWRKSEGFSGYKQTPVFQTSLCSRGGRQGLGRELWSLASAEWRSARTPWWWKCWALVLSPYGWFGHKKPNVSLHSLIWRPRKIIATNSLAHHTLIYATLSRKNKLSQNSNGEV